MEQETWNMATATLKRFDMLLQQSSFMSQNYNLIGWFGVLMDLRRNIIPFIPDKELKEVNNKFASIPQDWRIPGGKVHPQRFAQIHKTFDEIYIIFVTVMKQKGLLMPKSIDTSQSVIQM